MNVRSRTPALAAALVLGLAGCGDDPSDGSAAPADGDHGEMSMPMNDPDATPADQVEGEVDTATFQVLDTAPPGSEGVAGRSWLAQTGDGTTVTIRMTGLEPGTDYLAHLHEQACDEDGGGDHFAFDAEGPEEPPNEIHLAFTADDDGAGEATVANDRRVDDGAPSVVVHPADSMDNRLACADY